MKMDDDHMNDYLVEEEADDEVEDEEGGGEDEEYEFEAPRFFDFTREECDWEVADAERWFEVSGDYEPSPFIVKLNMEKLFSKEVVQNASAPKPTSNKKPWSGTRHGVSALKKSVEGKSSRMNQNAVKDRIRSSANAPFQPRSSTLMKPTASHLAKLNKLPDDSRRPDLFTRSGRASSNLSEKSSASSVRNENLGTKRQKLEMGGYLRKMAHLKHHISFLHKSSKKVTVPREPELETSRRAQRRSLKSSSASSDNESSSKTGSNFRALPLNRKILQSSLLRQPTKSTTPLTQSNMFRLKTMERADHHVAKKASKLKDADLRVSSSAKYSKRPDSREKIAKQEASLDSQADPSIEQEPELSTSDQLVELPPIEQFGELCLGPSDSEESSAPQSESDTPTKDVKETAERVPDSFQSEIWRSHGKPSQCADHLRVHERLGYSLTLGTMQVENTR